MTLSDLQFIHLFAALSNTTFVHFCSIWQDSYWYWVSHGLSVYHNISTWQMVKQTKRHTQTYQYRALHSCAMLMRDKKNSKAY